MYRKISYPQIHMLKFHILKFHIKFKCTFEINNTNDVNVHLNIKLKFSFHMYKKISYTQILYLICTICTKIPTKILKKQFALRSLQRFCTQIP